MFDLKEIRKNVRGDEPFYVRQHGKIGTATKKEKNDWLSECMRDSKSENQRACHCRVTISDLNSEIMLFEAWDHRPKNEGEPRFAYINKQTTKEKQND